uniref:U-box domain-containing protein n=1 Tax=Nymphaea colorata TaxID=210225 RepID=A0A5K1B735_9MAGN
MLENVTAGMMDKAVATLVILASNQEGKLAIGQAELITVLVDAMKINSPRNMENGVTLLLVLCTSSERYLTVAHGLGLEGVLKELTETGIQRLAESRILSGAYVCTYLIQISFFI